MGHLEDSTASKDAVEADYTDNLTTSAFMTAYRQAIPVDTTVGLDTFTWIQVGALGSSR
jgi:hypothetical protein